MPAGTRIGRWTIGRLLGEGAFGSVYQVCPFYHIHTHALPIQVLDAQGHSYAMKLEDKNAPHQLLQMEVLVLEELARNKGRHFCAIYDKGHYLSWNYVVMTMVGTSLHDHRKVCPLSLLQCFSYPFRHLRRSTSPWAQR